MYKYIGAALILIVNTTHALSWQIIDAIRNNRVYEIQHLLEQKKIANINEKDWLGITPLHFAVNQNKKAILKSTTPVGNTVKTLLNKYTNDPIATAYAMTEYLDSPDEKTKLDALSGDKKQPHALIYLVKLIDISL